MTKKHYHGHRKRVRDRFQKSGLTDFQDYEVLELLLLYVARQQDMKPVAKALAHRFGSFKNVLDASAEELQSTEGVGPAAITLIHFIKQAAARYLQQTSRTTFAPNSLEDLIQYCMLSMGAEPNEKFRLICLDSNFVIVNEEDIAEGTINQATVYPRRVMEIALQSRASTLVFVHNHPDGNTTPSEFDKLLTRNLVLAGKTMGMVVYDHIIVSRDCYFSFREEQLI
ncbi:MAG: DNA repair protein RadC [Anaerolineae bacterium]|nr:DNA repair protein RadC [Anaerolineae bacterium]MCB0213929.1 DNA repair protein RadC [Anaerolineae bacterium]